MTSEVPTETPTSTARASNIRVAGRRVELAPHNCFACGTLNTGGLQLVLHVAEARCWTEIALDRRFEGWDGIVHGGIVTTILDEVMAWSLVERELWGLTARLNVAFRRPVLVGRPVRAEGWVTQLGRRLIRTAGQIADAASGAVLATAEGVYLPMPEDRQAALRRRYRFRLVRETEPGSDRAPTEVDTRARTDMLAAGDEGQLGERHPAGSASSAAARSVAARRAPATPAPATSALATPAPRASSPPAPGPEDPLVHPRSAAVTADEPTTKASRRR